MVGTANELSTRYDVIENYPTSLANNSVFNGPNNFKFGAGTRCIVL